MVAGATPTIWLATPDATPLKPCMYYTTQIRHDPTVFLTRHDYGEGATIGIKTHGLRKDISTSHLRYMDEKNQRQVSIN